MQERLVVSSINAFHAFEVIERQVKHHMLMSGPLLELALCSNSSSPVPYYNQRRRINRITTAAARTYQSRNDDSSSLICPAIFHWPKKDSQPLPFHSIPFYSSHLFPPSDVGSAVLPFVQLSMCAERHVAGDGTGPVAVCIHSHT
jgi:hypothetical protein